MEVINVGVTQQTKTLLWAYKQSSLCIVHLSRHHHSVLIMHTSCRLVRLVRADGGAAACAAKYGGKDTGAAVSRPSMRVCVPFPAANAVNDTSALRHARCLESLG